MQNWCWMLFAECLLAVSRLFFILQNFGKLCAGKLREDLFKKFASGDGIAGQKPYGFCTRMIHCTGWKRLEANRMFTLDVTLDDLTREISMPSCADPWYGVWKRVLKTPKSWSRLILTLPRMASSPRTRTTYLLCILCFRTGGHAKLIDFFLQKATLSKLAYGNGDVRRHATACVDWFGWNHMEVVDFAGPNGGWP